MFQIGHDIHCMDKKYIFSETTEKFERHWMECTFVPWMVFSNIWKQLLTFHKRSNYMHFMQDSSIINH